MSRLRPLRHAALLSLLLAAIPPATGAPPKTMPVQGTLRDHAGSLVHSGRFAMTFRLYPGEEAEEPLWSETHPPGSVDCSEAPESSGCVTVSDGVFQVVLGTQNPLDPADFEAHDELWLGVSVEGEPELPRRPLGATAWAMAAQHAEVAGSIDCTSCIPASALDFAPSPWSEQNDGDVVRDEGRVGIGTDTPRARLDVDGGVGVGDTEVACTADNVGIIRYDPDNDGFQGCVDNDGNPSWTRLDTGCDRVRADCQQHFAAGCNDNGTYTIDPDGEGGVEPFEVFCDMERSGGGWTRLKLVTNRWGNGGGWSNDPLPHEFGERAKGGSTGSFPSQQSSCDNGGSTHIPVEWQARGTPLTEARIEALNERITEGEMEPGWAICDASPAQAKLAGCWEDQQVFFARGEDGSHYESPECSSIVDPSNVQKLSGIFTTAQYRCCNDAGGHNASLPVTWFFR